MEQWSAGTVARTANFMGARCATRMSCALPHQLFHVAIGKREAQIPADRHENHLGLKLPPFELRRSWFGHFTTLPGLARRSCNTADRRGSTDSLPSTLGWTKAN